MPDWICIECGYKANDKHTMERHTKRKYPCKAVKVDFNCLDCGYKANNKHRLDIHMKRKYPCNSLGIASRDKLEMKKIKDITQDESEEIEKINEKK
jgi:hypothetical protein